MNRLLCIVTTDDYGVPETPVSKRGLHVHGADLHHDHPLEKRGPPRPFKWTTLGGFSMETSSRRYGGPPEYMRLLSLRLAGLSEHYYAMRGRECERRRLEQFLIVTELPTGRPMDAQSNPIPTGRATRTPVVPESFWRNVWDNAQALSQDVHVGDSFATRQLSQAMAEALGSSTNPSRFMLLNNATNGAKGRAEAFLRNMSDARLRRLINRSIAGDAAATSEMLESLQEVSRQARRVDKKRKEERRSREKEYLLADIGIARFREFSRISTSKKLSRAKMLPWQR